jgi:hypothetical protein
MSWEERAKQRLYADTPGLAVAAERQKGNRDQKGGGKRQQRSVRAESKERFAKLAEEIRNARRQIQAHPPRLSMRHDH